MPFTRDELISKRYHAGELGRSAGNAVGEACNVCMNEEMPMAERMKRLDKCIQVANSEMRDLQEIIRECRAHFD